MSKRLVNDHALRVLAVIVVLVASCDETSGRSVEAQFAAYPYRGLPRWEPLAESTGDVIARPAPWISDGRPTVFVFTASWCPPCIAGLLFDLELARDHAERFQIGLALEESDADFTSSEMARHAVGVPVWSAASVRSMATRCGVRTIPVACLVHRGRVVFRGPPINVRHVLAAFAADPRELDARLATESAQRATAAAQLALGASADDVEDLVARTSSDPHWQHAIALSLASRREASATDLVVAVALARAAVAATGGLDYGHLDTYSLALSKAGRPEDAAMVGWRVLALCTKLRSQCIIERRRAYGFIYYWQETRDRPR